KEIDTFITALGNFQGRFEDLKHLVGQRMANWDAFKLEFLPIDGNQLNFSEPFLKNVKDQCFTTYLKEGTETMLYTELKSLCNKLNEVKKLFKEKTGCPDLLAVIEKPFFHHDNEYFKPDNEMAVWYFSYISEPETEV